MPTLDTLPSYAPTLDPVTTCAGALAHATACATLCAADARTARRRACEHADEVAAVPGVSEALLARADAAAARAADHAAAPSGVPMLPSRKALDAADARARAYARPGAPLDAAARADAEAAASARAYALAAAARAALYHVTTRDAADDILRNGFLPGWGDIGLGVYFYGSEREAMRYAQKGGWDGALRGEPVVVLAVQDPHIRRMVDADLDPSWNRSKYADMWFWEGRDEDAYMVPSSVSVASDLGIVGAKRGARTIEA